MLNGKLLMLTILLVSHIGSANELTRAQVDVVMDQTEAQLLLDSGVLFEGDDGTLILNPEIQEELRKKKVKKDHGATAAICIKG